MEIGQVIASMRSGSKCARDGWNGTNIHVAMQIPDVNSEMSVPYIYIDTTGLPGDNPAALKCLVPWLPSQTDLLADDWVIVG